MKLLKGIIAVSLVFPGSLSSSGHGLDVERVMQDDGSASSGRLALVFGKNELGEMADVFGIPNQCFSSSIDDEPSVGRFIHVGPDGSETQLGTGATVAAPDIVLTASHFLTYSNGRPIPAENINFRLYEGNPLDCREVDYPVERIIHGATDGNEANDFAVLKLRRPVQRYAPHQLASAELMARAVSGLEKLVLVGFPKHPATRNGLNYSAVSCWISAPSALNRSFGNTNIVVHNCDTMKGSSGAPLTIITPSEGATNQWGRPLKYTRHIVAIQRGNGSSAPDRDPYESSTFSPVTNYNDAVLIHDGIREAINGLMAE